jgi:hypothetical protein
MDSKKLAITGPCPIDLDAIGFDRTAKKAFCTHCRKNVINLSNMTRPEAKAFLTEHAGQTLCVSYARGEGGHIKFQPEATSVVPLSRVRRRPVPSRPAAAGAAAAGLALSLAACTPHGKAPERSLDRTEELDHGTARPVIPPTRPIEPVMAGAVPVPEQILDGEVAIPEDIVEGNMKVPEDPPTVEDEPCDAKPIDRVPDTPRPHLRGRIRLPDHPPD